MSLYQKTPMHNLGLCTFHCYIKKTTFKRKSFKSGISGNKCLPKFKLIAIFAFPKIIGCNTAGVSYYYVSYLPSFIILKKSIFST